MRKTLLQTQLRDFCIWELEHYHENRRQLEEVKRDSIPSPTPSYEGTSHGSEASRTTENVALRICSAQYIKRLEDSVRGVGRVVSVLSQVDRKLVNLVYWQKAYTVTGAAQVVGLSTSAAYDHINAILASIARELGYINVDL